MSDTIFTDNFPEIKNNEELQQLIKEFPKYDGYYIASGSIKKRKDFFDKLWINFKPYADKNFKKEIKTNFHQRSWEMYLGNLLVNNGLSIKSNNEGPDFIIKNSIYIECICVTKGDPNLPESVPEMFIAKHPKEIYFQDIPIDKMILRVTQAIKAKAIDQYKKWEKKPWFNENIPFIIAINTGDLGWIQDYAEISLGIKALFGLGLLQINKKREQSFSWRDKIKKGNSEIFVNYFTNKEFDFISGVIFSDNNILYYESNEDDCILINNPYAKNPVEDIFGFLDKWEANIDEHGITLNYIKKI